MQETNSMKFCSLFVNHFSTFLTILQQTPEQWSGVFYISAAVSVLGASIFGWLSSGQLQPWAASATCQTMTVVDDPEVKHSNDVTSELISLRIEDVPCSEVKHETGIISENGHSKDGLLNSGPSDGAKNCVL